MSGSKWFHLLSGRNFPKTLFSKLEDFWWWWIAFLFWLSFRFGRHIFFFIYSGNEIEYVTNLDSKKLSRLKLIELRGNKLTSTRGLDLQNIQKIYLGENLIQNVDGLENMEHLTTLYLRHNDISLLNGFSEGMKNLQYLNLRSVSSFWLIFLCFTFYMQPSRVICAYSSKRRVSILLVVILISVITLTSLFTFYRSLIRCEFV